MNLAVVIAVFDPRGGGAERSTWQIVRELMSRGHRVTIMTGWCVGADTLPDVVIDPFSKTKPTSPWWLYNFARWARKRLAAGRFDASLSVTTAVPATVVQPRSGTMRETLQRNIAMRSRPASRLTKRLLLGVSFKQQLLLALERRTMTDPRVRRIVPGSHYVADQLQRHYGINGCRVQMIPNAAEVPTTTDEQRRQWRERIHRGLQIPGGSTVYLFAAYNPRLKGIDPLLKATKRLVDQGLNPTLLLAGNIGFAHQIRAAELGIRPQVRIVATTDQMAQLYAAADVTVHPTFYDPASKVVIESLMMGVPAISTSFNGASDLIVDRRRGPDGKLAHRGRVIEDPLDIEALAQAMAQLADPEERARCTAAMDGLSQTLSVKRHVDQLEALLLQVAQEVR